MALRCGMALVGTMALVGAMALVRHVAGGPVGDGPVGEPPRVLRLVVPALGGACRTRLRPPEGGWANIIDKKKGQKQDNK